MLFSKRKGLSDIKDTIQKDKMDNDLRYGLWNALHVCIWEEYNGGLYISFEPYRLYRRQFI